MKKLSIIITFLILCLTFNIKSLAASEELVITGGELGVDYTYEDGIVTINNSNNYEISMAEGVEESSHQIVINYSETLKSISLTLNNVNLKTDKVENIKIDYPNNYENDLKINLILKGDNNLVAAHHPYHNLRNVGELTISSDGGSLTAEATSPPTSGYNDFNNGKFILESGTVTLKNQMIMTTQGIYIKGGNLNVSGRDENLYTNGEIIISGGNTNLTSDSGCAIHMVGTNTAVAGGGLQIIGDANLDIKTSAGSSASIFSGTRAKEDILIDTTGKINIDSNYIGIIAYNNSNLTINNGTVNIKTPGYGIYAYNADTVVTVNGGETEITASAAAIVLTPATQKSVVFGEDYYHKNYQGTEMASRAEVSDEELTNSNGRTNKYVLITPAYNIEYDLGEGSLEEGKENPTKYTRVDTFTLNNPIPNNEAYTFTGWTGTELDDLTEDVIIAEGSTGNRSYKANYVKNSDDEEEPDNREDTDDTIINPNTSYKYSPNFSKLAKKLNNLKTSHNNVIYIVLLTLSVISIVSIRYLKKQK